jgi:hypothetical protein
MALFSRETLAQVFWDGQESSYTPWWGSTRWPNGLPKEGEETYAWPYPCYLEEIDEDYQVIQEYLLEAHDIEAAIIKYADLSVEDNVCAIVEDMDLVICDNILQLACFGEIRYG